MPNNKINRRDFLRMAAVSAAGTAVLGSQFAKSPTSTVFASPALEDKITLTMAHTWEVAFQPTQEAFDKAYIATHPNIDIKTIYNTWADHQKIVLTWAASGEVPDVLYVHGSRAFPFALNGITVDLQKYMDTDKSFDAPGLFQEAVKLYKFKGDSYAIPYDHGAVILAYNKDMFDAAKVDYPTDKWTFDDLKATAIKLTKKGQWGYGGYYGGATDFGNEAGVALLAPWGGSMMNDDETQMALNTPESIAALNFWNDMIQKDHSATTTADLTNFPGGIWDAGVQAMWPLASWTCPDLKQNAKFNWDVVGWPTGSKPRVTGAFGSGYGMGRDSKARDATWAYLSAYLNKDGMIFMWGSTGRGSPAREAAYGSWMASPVAPKNAQAFLDATKNYEVIGHPYKTTAAAEILALVQQHTALISSADETVEAAVAAIERDAQPILAKAITQPAAATSSK